MPGQGLGRFSPLARSIKDSTQLSREGRKATKRPRSREKIPPPRPSRPLVLGLVVAADLHQNAAGGGHDLADAALAMARSQNPDSAGSQFYLCLGAQPMLDSGYTVFGQTIEGKDVIAQLRVGDVIEGIKIENAAE